MATLQEAQGLEFQALITGVLLGAVMKAQEDFLKADLEFEPGEAPRVFYVRGRDTGSVVKVETSVAAPEEWSGAVLGGLDERD